MIQLTESVSPACAFKNNNTFPSRIMTESINLKVESANYAQESQIYYTLFSVFAMTPQHSFHYVLLPERALKKQNFSFQKNQISIISASFKFGRKINFAFNGGHLTV